MFENTKEYKSQFYDNVKVILVILVVIGHACVMNTEDAVIILEGRSRVLGIIAEWIYSFHMPLFMLITGAVHALIAERTKDISFKNFVLKKFKRLMAPYLFFGIFYVAPVMVTLNFTEENYFEYVLNGILLANNSRHLWFLISLFGIFCMVEFVRRNFIIQNPLWYFVLSAIGHVVSIFMPNTLGIKEAFMYQFYFILGMTLDYLLNSKEVVKWLNQYKTVLMMSCFSLSFTQFLLPSNKITKEIFVFVGMIFMLLLVYNLTSLKKVSIVEFIKKDSMGIYLIHPMIIYVIYVYGKGINAYMLCNIAIIISFVVGIFGTNILRSIGLSKLLGEK